MEGILSCLIMSEHPGEITCLKSVHMNSPVFLLLNYPEGPQVIHIWSKESQLPNKILTDDMNGK